MSKQFVNDVVSIAILAIFWHEVPMPPLQTFSLYALVGVDWQSTRWHEVPLPPLEGQCHQLKVS